MTPITCRNESVESFATTGGAIMRGVLRRAHGTKFNDVGSSVVNRKFVAEIRIVMPVKTGIQTTENALDSGLRRNDGIVLRISDSGH